MCLKLLFYIKKLVCVVFASPILKSLTQGKFGVHSDGNLAIYFSNDVQETGKTVCVDIAMERKIAMS